MQTKKVVFSTTVQEKKKVGRLLLPYRVSKKTWQQRVRTVVLLALMIIALFFANQGYDFIRDCFYDWPEGMNALYSLWWGLLALLPLVSLLVIFIISDGFQSNFHPLDNRQFTYQINEQGVQVDENGMSKILYFWHGIERIEYQQGYILYFIDQAAALFIPERAFENAEQAQAFYQSSLEFSDGIAKIHAV